MADRVGTQMQIFLSLTLNGRVEVYDNLVFNQKNVKYAAVLILRLSKER